MGDPTYIFKDDHVYTMVDGKVVASAKEADFDPSLEAPGGPEVEMPEAPEDIAPGTCLECGGPLSAGDSFCPSCGIPIGPEGRDPDATSRTYQNLETPPGGRMGRQTVTTPNGVKGHVLARTPELWGEQVTVRWENGNITSIPIDKSLTFAAAEDASKAESVVERLEERLAAHFEQDKMSLIERGRELQNIAREASSRVASASDAEAVELAKVSTQADFELREIKAALDAILAGEQEAYEAPAPIESLPAVEQASMNGNDASWLDGVHANMVAEANSTDYLKIMDEGPERLVASLDPEQLADAGVTRIIATRDIEAKTAGADEAQQDQYKRLWLARVEEQRKKALAEHKEEVAEKTASSEPSHPDESLFL